MVHPKRTLGFPIDRVIEFPIPSPSSSSLRSTQGTHIFQFKVRTARVEEVSIPFWSETVRQVVVEYVSSAYAARILIQHDTISP